MKPPPASKKTGNSGRDRRLAAALRENLRRRKAQARSRAAEPDDKPPHAPEKPR